MQTKLAGLSGKGQAVYFITAINYFRPMGIGKGIEHQEFYQIHAIALILFLVSVVIVIVVITEQLPHFNFLFVQTFCLSIPSMDECLRLHTSCPPSSQSQDEPASVGITEFIIAITSVTFLITVILVIFNEITFITNH